MLSAKYALNISQKWIRMGRGFSHTPSPSGIPGGGGVNVLFVAMNKRQTDVVNMLFRIGFFVPEFQFIQTAIIYLQVLDSKKSG